MTALLGQDFRELADARAILRQVVEHCADGDLERAESIALAGLQQYTSATALAVVDAAAAIVLAQSLDHAPRLVCGRLIARLLAGGRPVLQLVFPERARGETAQVVAAVLVHIAAAESTLRTTFPAMWAQWALASPRVEPHPSTTALALGRPTWVDGVAEQLVDAAQRVITVDVFRFVDGGSRALAAAWRDLPREIASRIGNYYQVLAVLRGAEQRGRGR